MSKQNSFIMYNDWHEPIKKLPDNEKGALLDAMFYYHKNEDIPELPPAANMAFEHWKIVFKRDHQKYEIRCEKNRESIKKRWEKDDTNVYERIQPNTKHTDSDSDSDSDSDNTTAFPFDRFWDIYRKKTDRSKCERAYKRISETDRKAIAERLPAYIASTPELKFRKNPLTWLNGKCWQDEIAAAPTAAKPRRRENPPPILTEAELEATYKRGRI